MKRFISSLFLCVCCISFIGAEEGKNASAVQEPSKDYITCFTDWDSHLKTLQTHFLQTTEYDGLLISQSEGELSYKQSGSLLRLDNLEGKNITQSALTDKKTILMLDEKGKTISSLSWNEWSAGQPNKALFDFGNYKALIAKHNTVVLEYKQDTVLLKLTPKAKAENYTLYVSIQEKDCFPMKIRILSDLMQTTAVLSNTQINMPLQENLFKGIK
ncbi:MAG: outer membrane lipoprotein carrier protein LolA [Elusimicrobiaceae bacterium]|nr:outer membrane lipoprotein carrier protein LolA [Elusimicrobiaceae bacterium]